MDLTIATKFLRQQLDANSLSNWKIGINHYERRTEASSTIDNKTITVILNANWINQLPPDNTLFANEVQAIISNLRNKSFIHKTESLSQRKHYIHQSKCNTCGKVAKIKSRQPMGKSHILITFECNHVEIIESESKSDFGSLIWNLNPEKPNCKHKWGTGINYKECLLCGANRLYEFQILGCKALEEANGRLAILDEMGLGKAQSIDTNILTPTGFKKMMDLHVGDLVIASDGKPYPITGIYPQGLIDNYTIKFSDGSSTNCCDEHLWIVNTPIRKWRNQANLVKTFSDLKNDLSLTVSNSSGKPNNKWFIPIVKAIEFEKRELKIDPYLMGILLGDGHFGNQISFTTVDEEIVKSFHGIIRKEGISYFLDHSYLEAIRYYELDKARSNNKTIPQDYLYNTIENRLSILRGLMDSDGSIWNNGVVEFTSVSLYLANRLSFLVESLGGTCKITEKIEPKYTYKNEELIGQPCFRVVVNIPFNPFKLNRKAILWEKFNANKKYSPTRAIIGWGYNGKKVSRCIAVDSPDHSYVTENCIVTHNTIQAVAYLKFNLNNSSPYLWITKSKIKYQHQQVLIDILGIENMPFVLGDSKINLSFLRNTKLKGIVASWDIFKWIDLDEIKAFNFQAVILDECQAMKNEKSKRTKAIQELTKSIPKIIPLSGSFWKNRGSEAFVMLNMLDSRTFWSPTDFKNNYVRFYIDPITGKEREGGFKNPEKFRDKIAHIAIRRERNEVFTDFTQPNRTKLLCEVPEHARNVYNNEVKKIQGILRDAAIDGTENSFKTQQALNQSIIIMRQIVGLAKCPTVCEYLEEYLENDPDKRILVFVHHIQVGEIIYETMKKFCLENDYPEPLQIVGGTNAEVSRDIVRKFKNHRILILSTLGAGEGIDGLQEYSNDILFVERQWNPANEEQAEGRLVRIGQKLGVVNCVYALGDKTVDTTLDALVHSKRIEWHLSMNKSQMIQWNEESLTKQLIDAINKEKVA